MNIIISFYAIVTIAAFFTGIKDYDNMAVTPKELYDMNDFNWIACISLYVLDVIINPLFFVVHFFDWLFHVGRKKGDKHIKIKIKNLILTTALVIISFTACGCMNNKVSAYASNKMMSEWGTNYFNKAIIDIHKEIIEVDVKKWCDYDDSDAIVIISTDGTAYYTHLRDCTLIGSE